jgi:23S rRNA U2552 (ribose-2'-O)-methylase RlmE/FtsJ
MSNNQLIVYQLPKNNKKSILEYKSDPSFSDFPNMPNFKYGFYHYIHQTKDKMELFESKDERKAKDIHKIINAFEDTVPQDDPTRQFKNDKLKPTDDINTFSIKYFNSDKIISRAFYKLWELLMMFPLIKDGSKNINTIHIAEAPGSFAQAVILYRQKFFTKEQIKDDFYVGTSIEPNNSKEYVPSFHHELTKHKQFNQWIYKDADLTNPDIIRKFIIDHKKDKADFITADGGFNWKDENYQEQEAYILLLCEIYCAIETQKVGGSFVIKFFETFTETTVKMIEILKRFYKNVIITKPLLSRPSNSERYMVCIDFIGNQHSEKLLDIIEKAYKQPDKYIVDIFPDYQINHELDMMIKISATQLSNIQHKQINEMISYYNDGNYYGDAYRNYLKARREANDFWISLFFPLSTTDLVKTRKVITSVLVKSLDIVKKQVEELNTNLINTEIDYDSSTDTETEYNSDSDRKTRKTEYESDNSKKEYTDKGYKKTYTEKSSKDSKKDFNSNKRKK